MAHTSFNPYKQEVLKTFDLLAEKEIQKKLNTADTTSRFWANTNFSYRHQLMRECANKLEENKAYLAELATQEMGKLYKEAVFEVEKCAKVCRYYADNARDFLKNREIVSDASKSYVSYQPLGTIMAIMPWNFPYWQVFRFAAPALMAGNVVMLKHAPNVPQCALEIEKLLLSAGFSKGVFQTLLISEEQATEIIKDPVVKAITLTGSNRAGASVGATAAGHIKKTVMELGGSDPFIVLKDADLDKAINFAVRARLINNGQSCIAAKRFIIADELYQHFLAGLKDRLTKIKAGDPLNENTGIGPMAREDLAVTLENQVQNSIDLGAKLYFGKGKKDPQSNFFAPCILTKVEKDMPAYKEELFGPVFTVFSFKNENEAIELANDSPFGLGASVWSMNLENSSNFIEKLETGSVFINGMVKSDPRLPFGGIKNSGYGRELSDVGIKEFTNIKTVWINDDAQ